MRRVAAFARSEKLLRRVSKILVAVSGGPDSLALLLVLRELRAEFGFELEACHFDHQLHPDSRAVRERVRAICEGLGVECVTGEGDVRGVAKQNRQSIEEAARAMRYQFLAFVAGKEQCDAIAAGHTADDQAETVLLHILRGTGVRGVRGMLPSSPVPGSSAQRLIRPLLGIHRAETEAICREAGIEPLRDPGNDDPAFMRNRVRHQTLPVLREINPSVGDALRGLAASAREVFAGVERESMAVQPQQRTAVGAIFSGDAFRSLQSEAALLVIEREASFFQLQPEVNRTRLENLRAVLQGGTGVVAFGDVVVEVSCGVVRVGRVLDDAEPFEPKVLNVPGVTLAGGWQVELRTRPFAAVAGAVDAAIDADRIQGALRVREVREGDRMVFHGIERSVAGVLSHAKVPRWERSHAVAIADAGQVLAVVTPSHAIADRMAGDDAWFVRVRPVPPR